MLVHSNQSVQYNEDLDTVYESDGQLLLLLTVEKDEYKTSTTKSNHTLYSSIYGNSV